MAGTTPHGFPYPTGTDLVKDGDNSMQALAEAVESHIYAGAGAVKPGMWTDYAAKIVSGNSSTTAASGTSIVFARWMKIGRTLFVQGMGNTSAIVTGACALLPNAAGIAVPDTTPRTPVSLQAGMLAAYGSGVPADQSMTAWIVGASADRVQLTAFSGGARDLAAGNGFRWNLCYETAT